MHAPHPVRRVSELQLKILSELADPVVVTDHEQHVVYWNGPSERLFGLLAEQTLGHRLDLCCPELWNNSPGAQLLNETLFQGGRWSDEVLIHPPQGAEVWLELTVRVLTDSKARLAGFLWIGRDVTQRKMLEREVERYRDLLRRTAVPAAAVETSYRAPSSNRVDKGELTGGGGKDLVLWAEDDDNDAVLLARAWQKAEVGDRLFRVRDGVEVIEYLTGQGVYQDRVRYPLPSLLLLDVKMPRMSGLEVIEWLKAHPVYDQLRVVILTASAASTDIQQAARLGVRGYLVKPCTVAEWVYKAKTVTSQCG